MTVKMPDIDKILKAIVKSVREEDSGKVANYIPELAAIDNDLIGLSVVLPDGSQHYAGDNIPEITLQSAAKLVLLIGMLEEYGRDKVFSWVKAEPSGNDFNSLARLDQFGPIPSNPMLNAGAIVLSSHIPGVDEEQIAGLDDWMQKLFQKKCHINAKVLASERRTGNRNRSLAYLMKSNDLIKRPIKEVLECYFSLCSYEVTVQDAAMLPFILANRGRNIKGEQIISEETVRLVVTIMATCGLYNESGTHLLRTGMPAKSSVSGFILATSLDRAGIAAFSPRVNCKGTSVRAEMMLKALSEDMGWHFWQ